MDTSGKISEFGVDRITQTFDWIKKYFFWHLTRYILDASYDLGKWNLVEPGWTNQVDSYLVGTAITPSPLVIVTTLPLAFLVGNSWTILSVSLSKTSNYCESIFSIKTVQTWSWVELSGSRESSQRHWCPSLSCVRTIEDISAYLMIQWKSNLFSKVFLLVCVHWNPLHLPEGRPPTTSIQCISHFITVHILLSCWNIPCCCLIYFGQALTRHYWQSPTVPSPQFSPWSACPKNIITNICSKSSCFEKHFSFILITPTLPSLSIDLLLWHLVEWPGMGKGESRKLHISTDNLNKKTPFNNFGLEKVNLDNLEMFPT